MSSISFCFVLSRARDARAGFSHRRTQRRHIQLPLGEEEVIHAFVARRGHAWILIFPSSRHACVSPRGVRRYLGGTLHRCKITLQFLRRDLLALFLYTCGVDEHSRDKQRIPLARASSVLRCSSSILRSLAAVLYAHRAERYKSSREIVDEASTFFYLV